MQPSLPQNDKNTTERRNDLEKRRSKYQFNHDYVPPIPFLDHVPHEEWFSPRYTAERLKSAADVPPNMLATKAKQLWDPLDTLEEYDDLFVCLPKPGISKNYRSDESFGEQRLSGANPMSVRRINRLPEGFGASDALMTAVLGRQASVEVELKEGRLYFLDFPNLDHVKGGSWKGAQRYMPKPRAMFVWNPGKSRMEPVAIQLGGHGSKLFTPADPELDWFSAKLAVQIADATAQELGVHFAHTHVVMGPFAVVTNRQLALHHPIHLMLKPHFRFMLHDNELGRTQFIQDDGPVERMMAGTLEESITIAARYYGDWSIQKAVFPTEIANRNMDDVDLLGHYPFREDGMKLWKATEQYVIDYLKLYYSSNEDIANDYELQNWAEELAAKDAGCTAGMPERIETMEQLVEIITVVIYTCAPLHSALNFAQYEYIGYIPNMPYAAYHEIPENGGVDMEMLMKILPPFDQASYQLKWTELLTSYKYDKYAHYDEKFEDPRAQALIESFQATLDEIEKEIDRDNLSRPVAYKYFKPSEIINSINT